MSEKNELDDEEMDDAFREYNRLGRLIDEAEKIIRAMPLNAICLIIVTLNLDN